MATSDRRMLERTHEDLANDVAIIAAEFLGGFQKVLEIDRPAVSIFGSARVPEESAPYREARATAKLFAEAGFAVVTGGGPGVMEAAQGTAGLSVSVAPASADELLRPGHCYRAADRGDRPEPDRRPPPPHLEFAHEGEVARRS